MRRTHGIVFLGLLLSSIAMGATTFDLTGSGSFAYSRNYTVDGIGLTLTGWTERSTVSQQLVGQWSGGSGVEYLGSPQHAIDNDNGHDMLLLCFDQMVHLDAVSSGWGTNDTDMSVLALPTGATVTDLTGVQWAGLLSGDWVSAGNYANIPTNGTDVTIQETVYAKCWLVGAYDSALPGPTYGSGPIGDPPRGLDYFKLKTATVTSAVPAPGAFLLGSLGVLAVSYIRRRRL